MTRAAEMVQTVMMNTAVQALSCAMDLRSGLDAFDASTVLAIMFDIDKDTALDKLLVYRKSLMTPNKGKP